MSSSAIIISSDSDLNILDWCWSYVSRLLDVPGQLTILLLLLIVFALTLYKIHKDSYLWSQIVSWVRVSIGSIILVVIMIYISPIVLPTEDPWALYRVVLLRTTSFLMGLTLLTGGILFVASVLPPGIIKKVEDAPYGPTIIIATIVAALAYLITFS